MVNGSEVLAQHEVPVEVLAQQEPPEVGLSQDAADRVAHLALRLTQVHAQRSQLIVTPAAQRPYHERTEAERAAMRAGVIRVVQALMMLGWTEE